MSNGRSLREPLWRQEPAPGDHRSAAAAGRSACATSYQRLASRAGIRRALGALLLLGLPTALAFSQERAPRIQILEIAPSNDRTVRALVAVSEQGRPVTGLTAANFAASLDRRAAAIAKVEPASAPDQPLSVVLVMDISGSMKGAPIAGAITGAESFLGRLGAADYAALITCGDQARIVTGFKHDIGSLQAAVGQLRAADSRTLLYQSIFDALDLAAGAPSSRSAVVVLTEREGRRQSDRIRGSSRKSGEH